jgi:uncharacterized membrane protein
MGPLRVLRSWQALIVCGLGCVGELVADVLPFVPSRLKPAPLGALLGGLAAVVGAVGGYSSRMYLSRQKHLPGVVGAVAEDLLTLGLGLLALRPSLFPSPSRVQA